jgi:omega-6 fatty acid desaturase (delta-12 desaturase)
MSFNPVVIVAKKEKPAWYATTAVYARPDMCRSTWQLANTLIPYFVLMATMTYAVRSGYPYWIVLVMAVTSAGLFTRIFIIFHDCTHGSFLHTPRWNRNLGYLCGIITFTPFHDWRRSHAGHHITTGDLDRRGIGDITLMTVAEYRSAPFLKRLAYRFYRHPLIMFGIGPAYYFLLRNRLPSKGAKRIDWISVMVTNMAIAAIVVVACLTIGFRTYLQVQLPVVILAATIGIWLFYIQHQFEGVYWARHDTWDPWRVAMEGASFYHLPKALQWITGNIGYHHVHHMRPGIPNYNLERCYREVPELQSVTPITLLSSLKSIRQNLYDEERQRMVSFREAHGIR